MWGHFEPFVAKACAYSRGRYTPDWAIEAAYSENANIWAILDGASPVGAVVTTLQRYPTGLIVAQVMLTGGAGMLRGAKRAKADMDSFRVKLNAWAKQWGAQEIEWMGRENWSLFFDDVTLMSAVASIPVL